MKDKGKESSTPSVTRKQGTWQRWLQNITHNKDKYEDKSDTKMVVDWEIPFVDNFSDDAKVKVNDK